MKKIISILRKARRAEYVEGPLTYNQDGLATRHNADFIKDRKFASAYAAGKATGSWGDEKIHWRAFVACWAAERALSLDGDFVECGVNRGGLARAIIEFTDLKSTPKKFFLFDTFDGLVEELITEQEKDSGIRTGGYKECYAEVLNTFSLFPNVKIIKGPVPSTLSLVKIRKVSFLSIDMNCVTPEIEAAEYFWDKIVSGGTILLDDYGWRGHIAQKHGFDNFSEMHGVRVLALPTGQGLIIKP
jgi:O-methyltransferase